MDQPSLDAAAGRPLADRRDSRDTRRRLIEGIGSYAAVHGAPPGNLADVARHAGVSTATAYRHFESLADLANAHLARLPARAVELFGRSRAPAGDALARLEAWDLAWVKASIEHAETTVPLRSAKGFLARRRAGDPLVTYVADHVTPLLDACGIPTDVGLAVWNAVSDPREVADLRTTLGWSAARIARHVTRLTLACRDATTPHDA